MEHNDKYILKLLLDQGGRPDTRSRSLCTPLHYAAQNGFDTCVEILVNYVEETDRKRVFNSTTRDGCTALMLAAKKGFTECCKLLEETDINIQDKNGRAALHFAATKGSLSITELLVSHGANCSLRNNKGETALYLAAAGENVDCMIHLIDHSNSDDSPSDILHIATKNKSLRCVEELLSRNKYKSAIDSQNGEGNTCLHLAIKNHCYEIAHALLNCEANKNIANSNKEYPLHVAAAIGKGDNRASQKRRYVLCNALMKRSYMIVNKFNYKNETPLHVAANSGNVLTVRALILRGCRILAKNGEGLTAVQVAARAGQDEILQVFIRSLKRAIDRREVLDHKPHLLHLVAKHGHLSCCQTIVRELKIRELTIEDEDGRYPVDLAHSYEKLDVFCYLISEMKGGRGDDKFACRLHQYCEDGIAGNVQSVFEAIIKSDWCMAGFDSQYCERARKESNPRPCMAFKHLIKEHPQLACTVMDKMIQPQENEPDIEEQNFMLFEFIYYNKPEVGGERLGAFTATDEVTEAALEYRGVSWSRDHPLMEASLAGHTDVLQHRLTRSWLELKMQSYTTMLLYAYIVLDFGTAVVTTLFINELKNPAILQSESCNTSLARVCQLYSSGDLTCTATCQNNTALADDCVVQQYGDRVTGNMVWQLIMFLLFLLLVLFEYNFLVRIKRSVRGQQFSFVTNFKKRVTCRPRFRTLVANISSDVWKDMKTVYSLCADYSSPVRYMRLCALLVVLVPGCRCCFGLAIRGNFQWSTGVICVLLSWMHLVSTINRVPTFTIFMPFTITFFMNFLKIVLHIIVIIFAFSTAFHFLLKEEFVFRNMWTSFIKTLEWMLGELSYEDTFLDESTGKVPSVMGSILFVVYVTTIAFFIVNMFMMHSEDQIQPYKALAKFHLADSSLRMQLFVDECFPKLRRRYAKRKIQKMKEPQKSSDKPEKCKLSCISTEQRAETKKMGTNDEEEKDKSDLGDKMELLMEEIAELKNEVQKLGPKKRLLHQINEDDDKKEMRRIFRNRRSSSSQ